MSRWKKIVIGAALLIIVLCVAIYAFLSLYDFNKLKPTIAKAVKDATGRELTIAGNIEIKFGLRPTIVVEGVGFQNATWSSTPDLAQVKRLEVRIAFWPLIFGKFDIARLVLVEPDMIVELDEHGTSNFSFKTSGPQKNESALSPPPLIFNDVLLEKGRFTYRDAQSGLEFSIRIDRLKAEIPGFDKSLQIDFKGAFDDLPFALRGTVGPIWAWVEPGYALPANITVTAGGATAEVNGEIHDPTHFKDLGFTIAAQGASTAAIAKLAGLTNIPELGAFKLTANVSDPQGRLAVENLDLQIGSDALVAVSVTGDIHNVPALQGFKLDVTAQGRDVANLTKLGLPTLLRKGAFKVTADISDPETNVFRAGNLSFALGNNEINGPVTLNLAEKVPYLTAELTSQKSELGPGRLDLKLVNPFGKAAIDKLDLQLGTPKLAKIHLNGTVSDLLELQGVDIRFQANGKDLANLKQLTGQPLPVRGSFSAAGEVLIPVHQHFKIPDLKISVGKNTITGSLGLDLTGDRPELTAILSSPQLDLPSVLLPKLAKQGWAEGLKQVRPVKLSVKLAGYLKEIAVQEVNLQAGTLDSVEVRLKGAIENLAALRGADLNFSVRGKKVAKLKEILAQPYIFVPVPGQGAYALAGTIRDPIANDFEVSNFKLALSDNELTGRLEFNLSAQPPHYEVELSAPQFNLKPFPIPKQAAYHKLNQIENLGPLKIHSKISVEGGHLSLPFMDLQVGSEQLAAVQVKGSIKNLTDQSGIGLQFNIRGNDVADLTTITDRPIPLQGAYAISGKLTDPAPKEFKFSDLALKLGPNDISGQLDLNLSGPQLQLSTELASPKFTLQPVTLPAIEKVSRIEDLGPLKLTLNLAGAGDQSALNNLNLMVGSEKIIKLLLKGSVKNLSAMQGMNLEFTLSGKDISKITAVGGPEMHSNEAFRVSGRFADTAPQVYKLSDFDAVLGDSQSSGWLELDTAGQRPQLKAELSSDKLDLRPFLAQPQSGGKAEAQTADGGSPQKEKTASKEASSKSGTGRDRVFPADPLPLADLQRIDADIKYRGKQVLLKGMAMNDLVIDILLRDGNLDIKPFKFKIGGGDADGWINLHSRKKPAEVATTLMIDQMAIGPMLDQLGYSRTIEGNLDAVIDLDGSGDSVAALMAGLNGEIHIAAKDGKAESRYLDLLEKYLGTGFLQMINPFKKQSQYTPINCFVDSVKIDDGNADIKLLLDTDQTSIFGAGTVNLKTETLDLGIKPTPKKSALPADISFSLNSLSQPFRLGGTFADPHLALDPGRTAFLLGKMAGALALGPIGIAAFFADISLGKKDACAVALEKAEKKIDTEENRNPAETPQKAGAETQKEKEKKSPGFFERLFGK